MIASDMRGYRVVLACLALLCFLAPARESWAGTQRDSICQGCGDGPGCTPCSRSGESSSSSSNPGIAWGGMTKRNMEMVWRDCSGKPLCFLVQGTIGLLGGAITDVPYYAVKGVGYGLYYGGKGLYYGARGLGKGLAYTGRSIGRGIAYPFNRPPKPKLPPTTWEQYKHDVLRHQKALTKANKANKANQRWCVSRVPLDVSAGLSEWEARCNPGDAVSRAALPKAVIAGAMVTVVTETIPTPTPAAAHASPSAMPAAIAPVTAALPALQDPTKALGESDSQAKTAGASGFDDSGPMAGKPAPTPDAESEVAVDAQPTPISKVIPEPESTAAAATASPDEIPTGAESALKPEAAPDSTPIIAAAAPLGGVPAGAKSTPTPSPAKTSPTVAGAPPVTPSVPPAAIISRTTPAPSVPPVVPSAPTTTAAPPASPSFVVPKFVVIEGDKKFKLKVIRDLEIISKTKSGRALFMSLESGGKSVRVAQAGPHGNGMFADPKTSRGAGIMKTDGTSGARADSVIEYNPDMVKIAGSPGSVYDKAKWANPPNRPADVGLFHEMVHADDYAHGRYDETPVKNSKRPGPDDYQDLGEMRAAGLIGKYPYSENTYRSERLTADGKPLLPREFY